MTSFPASALAAVTVAVIAATTFTPASAATQFNDIKGNDFTTEITWLADQGITNGWSNNDGTRSYKPLANIERGAMAAFLYRMAGSPAYTAPAKSQFKDVTSRTDFYKEIHWLKAQGITTGWSDGTFRPLASVNRDTMAAFLYRFAGKPAYTAPVKSEFTDVRVGQDFYKEMSWLRSTGISNGWTGPGGTRVYKPVSAINRDAMAAFLYRYHTWLTAASDTPTPSDPTIPSIPETGAGDRWAPAAGPGTQWQWQINGSVPRHITGVNIYGMDGESTSAAQVKELQDKGAHTICYISAGSWEDWRGDAGNFPMDTLGEDLDGWAGERWLDVRAADKLLPLMGKRMDDCAVKGFDAVEVDNIDGYANDSGFPISYADQLAYNKGLAELAHDRGLSIALKNDVDQIAELEPHFDFAINEECFVYEECEKYAPFTEAGKAVLNVEYTETTGRCATAKYLGISSMRKNLALDSWRQHCSV